MQESLKTYLINKGEPFRIALVRVLGGTQYFEYWFRFSHTEGQEIGLITIVTAIHNTQQGIIQRTAPVSHKFTIQQLGQSDIFALVADKFHVKIRTKETKETKDSRQTVSVTKPILIECHWEASSRVWKLQCSYKSAWEFFTPRIRDCNFSLLAPLLADTVDITIDSQRCMTLIVSSRFLPWNINQSQPVTHFPEEEDIEYDLEKGAPSS